MILHYLTAVAKNSDFPVTHKSAGISRVRVYIDSSFLFPTQWCLSSYMYCTLCATGNKNIDRKEHLDLPEGKTNRQKDE